MDINNKILKSGCIISRFIYKFFNGINNKLVVYQVF